MLTIVARRFIIKSNEAITKLSIPPIAIAVIERVAKNAKALTVIDSNWAVPQARNIYLLRSYANSNNWDGIRRYDKPITPSALNHALDSLAGRKPGWPNLLQMVGLPDRIGPHDLRRSLTTFFENIGLGSYASALLDHKGFTLAQTEWFSRQKDLPFGSPQYSHTTKRRRPTHGCKQQLRQDEHHLN